MTLYSTMDEFVGCSDDVMYLGGRLSLDLEFCHRSFTSASVRIVKFVS